MSRPLLHPQDMLEALGFMTRLPLPGFATRGVASAWAWPFAGAILGLIAGVVGLATNALGLSPALCAALALATLVVVSGALHEDGLADVADGFWGGYDTERRLDIMKDSRIGAYGVIALCLGLLTRWAALAVLFEADAALIALVAAGALSRAPMAVLMAALPNARGTGVSAHVGTPAPTTALAGVGLSLLLGGLCLGAALLPVVFWIAMGAIGMAALAKSKIGGQTGDVLGATQQVSEIIALSVLSVALA